jgi:tRNA dimethylallyltransferase
VRSTGRALTEWQKERVGGIGDKVRLTALVLLPPRAWLYERCNERFEKIVSGEGIEEVRSLLSRRLSPVMPVMRAIGVPEIQAMLEGRMNRAEALEAGGTATRQYAKRQYTWFSRQPPADWPRFGETLEGEAIEKALGLLCPS